MTLRPASPPSRELCAKDSLESHWDSTNYYIIESNMERHVDFLLQSHNWSPQLVREGPIQLIVSIHLCL